MPERFLVWYSHLPLTSCRQNRIKSHSMSIEFPVIFIIVAILCLPIYKFWAEILFGSVKQAIDNLRWFAKSDMISLLKSNYLKDKFAELKWTALLFLCVSTVFSFYAGSVSIAFYLGLLAA
jgi:hypothetical protein